MVSFHTILPSEGTSLSSYLASALRKMGFLGSQQGRKTLLGKEGTPERLRAARSAAEGLPSIVEVVPDATLSLEAASLL